MAAMATATVGKQREEVAEAEKMPVEAMMANALEWEREADSRAEDVDDGIEGLALFYGLTDSFFGETSTCELDEIDALLRLPSAEPTGSDELEPPHPELAYLAAAGPPPAAAAEQEEDGASFDIDVLVQEQAKAKRPPAKQQEQEQPGAWVWDIKLVDCGRNGFSAVRVRVPAPAGRAPAPVRKGSAPAVVDAVPASAALKVKVTVPAKPVELHRVASPTSVMMVELKPEAKIRRAAALVRWRAKRKRRQFGRVVYKRRKVIANSRPRQGGRFVKTCDTKWVTASSLKK